MHFCFIIHFFQEFSVELSIEISSCIFSFCLTFSVFLNLGKTVTCCGLEGVSLSGNILVPFSLPSAFGGRPGFDLKISHVFGQGLLASVMLVGGEAGDGLGLKPSVDQGLSAAQWS